MRIFLAGASGVIGQRLIPRLVQAGHGVGGMTRSPSKTELLSSSRCRTNSLSATPLAFRLCGKEQRGSRTLISEFHSPGSTKTERTADLSGHCAAAPCRRAKETA